MHQGDLPGSPICAGKLRWQAVSGKTTGRMYLVDQDARFDSRIVIHDLSRILDARIEDTNPCHIALVGYRINDSEQPFFSEGEIPSPMFPKGARGPIIIPVRASLQIDPPHGYGRGIPASRKPAGRDEPVPVLQLLHRLTP